MSHQTKTYLKALAQLREPGRIHHTGTTCSNCGTHFMPNPEKQTTGTCGLCKVRLIAGPTIKAIIPDLRDMLPNERKNFQQYYKKIYRKVIPNAPKRESIAEMARRRGLTPVSRGIEKWTDDSLLESQT